MVALLLTSNLKYSFFIFWLFIRDLHFSYRNSDEAQLLDSDLETCLKGY